MPSAESAMFIGGNRRSWYNRHVLTVDGGLSQLAETVQEATASSIMNTDTTKKWPNVDTEKGCSSVEPENIRLEATDDDRSRKTKNLTPVDELIRFWVNFWNGTLRNNIYVIKLFENLLLNIEKILKVVLHGALLL